MGVIGIDLGGTKLASAIFNQNGKLLYKDITALEKRGGKDVGILLQGQIHQLLAKAKLEKIGIEAVGISVPGIYYLKTGNVWAPNIGGWDNYPLKEELQSLLDLEAINIKIDSDRACYILGETWQGAARGCQNAIFLAVGTGIGAGILVDGNILRGNGDIAGAIGWMALTRPYTNEYGACGSFEYHASGEGIGKITMELIKTNNQYQGVLRKKNVKQISSYDVFQAYQSQDPLAFQVLTECVQFWGMAIANLISLFNPEKIILGGGIFGPALQFLDQINKEAQRWAQPISFRQVKIEPTKLGDDAGLYGAGRLALLSLNENN